MSNLRFRAAAGGILHKRYITNIETLPDGTKIKVTLEEVIKRDFPDAIKTDITPVIIEVNAGYPRIKYNF